MLGGESSRTGLLVSSPLASLRQPGCRVVTKMVDRGLMRRRRPRNDRRVVFLTLTDEGKALTLELHR